MHPYQDIRTVLHVAQNQREVLAPGAAVDGWDLAAFRSAAGGARFGDLTVGDGWEIRGGDVVSGAPGLARRTLKPLPGGGGLARLRSRVRSGSGPVLDRRSAAVLDRRFTAVLDRRFTAVLDWRFTAVLA